MEIISRKQALAAGRVRFYTGRPCKNGHDCERYTSTGGCAKCVSGSYRGTWKIIKATRAPENSPRAHGFLLELPLQATLEQRNEFVKYLQKTVVPWYFEKLGLKMGPP